MSLPMSVSAADLHALDFFIPPTIDPVPLEKLRAVLARDRRKRLQWAREHGFAADLVANVLNGKLACRWGMPHRVAVLLGLREARVEPAPTSPEQIREELNRARRIFIAWARARGYTATVTFEPLEHRRYKLGEISLNQFARQHGFSKGLVSGVLSGKVPANKGKSREIAILLGIKQGEIRL